ncbi:hypothetical protein IGI04_040710 [Brassica rapa subsp. trilocularis]|uniref:Arabidopsis retrotransposon Orf1 C-terminal domain-containing protein n=1 Tax=Brassica rapa subsp. trilocularis TaxID=1813537 RepID=A0ABQ7KPF1_BRACM|nr:hypothetical protein IGI04_040710 [Brassica rapa subsp. trilocularis]
MFRLHFAYMSPYQVLEYHMEFLETFGCIWSSKEVFKRHDEVAVPYLSERPNRSDVLKSLCLTSRSDHVGATRSDLSQRHPEVAPEAQSDVLERLAEVAARRLYARIHVFSRAFLSFHYAPTRRQMIFVLRKTTKNLWKVISLNQLINFVIEILCSFYFISKLDHPRSNPYIHEFSFPIVKKRGLTATPQGRSSWERGFESDTPWSLAFSSSDQEKSPQSEVLERGRRVAPAGSDIMGAIPRSRSRFRRNGAQKLTRSDVLERHLEVAPAQSEVSRATLQGRSRFCRNTTRGNDSGATSPSDTLTSLPTRSSFRPCSLFLTTHSPFPFIQSKVKMVKKTKGRLEAERQEAENQEFALRGKALTSEPTGSGTQRTVRQQTLAARKSKEHEKRAGKSVAVPTHEEGETESDDEPAPTKKAKMSKGKGVAVDRDRAKTPSVEELYDHLKNGVTWAPTRFADLNLLKELGLDSDIEAMLGHLKMPKLLTMAYPFYKDVTCQFLSSLVVTYHDTAHVRQGWGKITFKVNGREYNMNFKDIGRVMGFQDLEDHSLPKCENLSTELWKLITGNRHSTWVDKNSHIRHPSVRYLHRLLVHAFYPRKQADNVTEEDMRLLCPAIRPYTQPGVLPLPSTDIYATFGMVSFFVGRLEHYRDWAWYTTDSRPKMGIGGMITPLLQFLNVPLGQDAAGPRFIDGTYLRIATYFSGMYGKDYVYHYYLQGKPVEVVLPNRNLTSLEIPGAVSFNIPQECFLGEHGPLDPIQAASSRRRSVPTQPDPPVADTSEHIYGPPRYYFKPHDGVLPPGALRDAHDHIGRLQRWNKAQDRTIAKLKDKYKALSKTVKKQAKTSAKFMKKVADVLTRGGIAGCSSADFAFANTSNPQPPPPPDALGFPPHCCAASAEHEIDEVESQPWYGGSGSASGELKAEAGATSRSDTLRSLPKPRATCWSDLPRSLRVAYLLEFMFSQGPFCHFIMHKNHQKPLESHLFESIDQFIIEILCSYLFPVFLYMINLKSNMGLRGIMEISDSKLDHPRSNPYIHEFSFPIVKKFKNPSKSLVALRLSDYLHSRCFDISQNWFDNHLYYNICLRSLENS